MTLPIKTALAFAVLFAAVVFASRASGLEARAPQEPHDFRSYGLSCRSCHVSVSIASRSPLQKSVGEICAGCHKNTHLAHPVDIKPTFSLPPGLPLDQHGLMTCATCHDPHGPAFDAFTGRKTLFLRRDGSKKAFCQACHRALV